MFQPKGIVAQPLDFIKISCVIFLYKKSPERITNATQGRTVYDRRQKTRRKLTR